MNSRKNSVIYVYPSKSTFILRDIEILGNEFDVKENFFDIQNKKKVPLQFIRQFFFLLRNLRSSKGIICHFAGYSSLLPSLLGKLFNRPCLIIVAGNDGSKFPDFSYGNYTKKVYGFITGLSLRNACHILPVHESLYYQDYDYYEGGKPAQGYSVFVPKAKNVPFTPVYYGYDASLFNILPNTVRKKNTYLTIGNLSSPYIFKRKGYDIIIELAKMRSDCQFTLVGWNGNTPIEVPENVTLLPFKNQQEIIELFNQHQFYFQLSVMEGFPNALAEAMLCGCIPIGSNVSGIPYIIQKNGYILKHRDVNDLSKIVDQIKGTTEETLEQMSIQARKRVAEEFTFENRKNKIIRILNSYTR